MGLASPTVVAILVAFAVSAAGQIGQAVLRSQESLSQAARAQGEHTAARATGLLSLVNRTWLGGGALDVRINNTGGQPFDAGLVEVLGDGSWISDKITSRTVNGNSTRVWAPGDQLLIHLQGLGSNPVRLWFVTDTGDVAVG